MGRLKGTRRAGRARRFAAAVVVSLLLFVLSCPTFATSGAGAGAGDISTALFDIVFNAITIIVAAVGVIYGGYMLFEGFTNDQPEAKKNGVKALIVTGVACGVLQSARLVIAAYI